MSEEPGSSLRGGLFMSAAMASFIINDTIAKWIASDIGVGQFIFVRGVFASLMLLALLGMTGRASEIAQTLEPRLLLRAVLDFVATTLFIFALFHMPIGSLNAMQQASPLAATALAWVLLGERFGWRRFVAIVLGFLGVLLVARPGYSGFDVYMLAALGAMLGSAFRDVLTRRIATHVSSLAVALANAAVVAAGGLAIALIQGFQPMPMPTLAGIGVGALFLVAGYVFFVLAIRTSDIASTAPFRYTIIVWALCAGYLVFGEVPDAASVLGILLIVGAGLFTIYRTLRLTRTR